MADDNETQGAECITTEALIRRVRSARFVMTLTQKAASKPVGVMLTEVEPNGQEVITSFIVDDLVGDRTKNVVPITRAQLRALGQGQGTTP